MKNGNGIVLIIWIVLIIIITINFGIKNESLQDELQLCKSIQTIQTKEISKLKTQNEFLSKENKILAEQITLPRPIIIGEQKCKP